MWGDSPQFTHYRGRRRRLRTETGAIGRMLRGPTRSIRPSLSPTAPRLRAGPHQGDGSGDRVAIAEAPFERDFARGLGGRGCLVVLVPFRLGPGRGVRGGAERQRDPFGLGLDLEDADLDLLPRLDQVGDAADAVRRQLADVDQALDPRLQLDEGAELHDPRHLPLDGHPERVRLLDAIPGARGELLQSQADFARRAVDLEDLDLHFLTDLEELGRVRESRPAHLGDVEQAIHAPYVHERAEVLDRPDDALADLPFLELRPGLLAL